MALDAAVIAAARLRPEESQAVFRALLDALARPGRPTRLPAAAVGRAPSPIVALLALADIEVGVAVTPDGAGWAAALTTATGAPVRPASEADWVAFLVPPSPAEVAELDRGSALAPERGTRLVVAVESIAPGASPANDAPGDEPIVVTVSGPGVPDTVAVTVGGVDPSLFEALAAANAEFPAGLDTWLVTADGAVVGLPRSSHVAVTIPPSQTSEGAR